MARARDELRRLGRSAITDVVGLLEHADPEVRRHAVEALGAMGELAVPALRRSLRDSDVSVQQEAAIALGSFGPAAQQAVEELIRVVEHGSGPARQAAVEALGQIGSAADAAVPHLSGILRQGFSLDGERAQDFSLRIVAATALANIGEPSRRALPAMKELHEIVGREAPQGTPDRPEARMIKARAMLLQAVLVEAIATIEASRAQSTVK